MTFSFGHLFFAEMAWVGVRVRVCVCVQVEGGITRGARGDGGGGGGGGVAPTMCVWVSGCVCHLKEGKRGRPSCFVAGATKFYADTHTKSKSARKFSLVVHDHSFLLTPSLSI
jgi:hypothetical protein